MPNTQENNFTAAEKRENQAHPRRQAPQEESEGNSRDERRRKALAYLSTPQGFAEHVLGTALYPWQSEVVGWFGDQWARTKGACSAPNGSGKSERIISTLSLFRICTKPKGRVVITSKDARQLDEQVWPAFNTHRARMGKGWEWRERQIATPQGGMIYGFVTDDPNRAEGWHAKPEEDSPLMIILDEAKSIPELIFQAVDRCTYTGLLYISSTGLMQGSFYAAMTGKRGFHRRKVGLLECPHIPQARIDDLNANYAPDDPFLLSTLHSEFMDFSGDYGRFVTLSAINKCLESPPQAWPGETVAACDFAGGGAENVLAIRRGNAVTLSRCWREKNEMAAVGEFIRQFRTEGLRPGQIWGDNAGAGKPMISRFHELGWPINRFNGGEAAARDYDYANRNAEVWEMGGREIKRGHVIIPDEPTLHSQLVDRHRNADSRGRIKCESKEDMAKRGVRSPDRGDAVMMALGITPVLTATKADELNTVPSWMEYLAENAQEDVYASIEGADAGC